MKTRKNKKGLSKVKIAIIKLVLLAIALFFANKGIDTVRGMSEAEFWGMFESKPMVFENPPMVSKVAHAASEEVETPIVTPEPIKYTHKSKLTAYNSVPEQTDGNPCIAADGTNVCEFEGCVVAQNGVPFGTKVDIEGVGVCHVHDRKNSRYDSNWIDIYFGGRDKVAAAFEFGSKEAGYRIVD